MMNSWFFKICQILKEQISLATKEGVTLKWFHYGTFVKIDEDGGEAISLASGSIDYQSFPLFSKCA